MCVTSWWWGEGGEGAQGNLSDETLPETGKNAGRSVRTDRRYCDRVGENQC